MPNGFESFRAEVNCPSVAVKFAEGTKNEIDPIGFGVLAGAVILLSELRISGDEFDDQEAFLFSVECRLVIAAQVLSDDASVFRPRLRRIVRAKVVRSLFDGDNSLARMV